MSKTSGLFWHVHHDVLFEYCYDAEGRIAYIKSAKPEAEQATRLRLMKPVQGSLGDAEARAEYGKTGAKYDKARAEYDKARAKYDKAGAEYDKARAEYDKACAEYDKACAEYVKAGAKYDKARAECGKAGAEYGKARAECGKAGAAWCATIKPGDAEALHAKECPDCPWNGETIFPDAE